MSSSGRSVLSVYAREILELHPVWRFRGISGPGHGADNADQPASESPAADALPLPGERIYCWSVSVSSAPVSAGLREALQRAAALALAPAGSLVLHWEEHLLPDAAGQTDAQPSTATAEGPLSLQALQRWLVAQQTGPQSEALPRLVLVWGAEFSGPVAAEAATGTWLLGLPPPGQFLTAAARRQTWADLLALKRLLT
jgi:hypothetical protein